MLNLCLPDLPWLKWWDYLLPYRLCAANMRCDGPPFQIIMNMMDTLCSWGQQGLRELSQSRWGDTSRRRAPYCIIAVGSCLNRLTVSFIVDPAFLLWLLWPKTLKPLTASIFNIHHPIFSVSLTAFYSLYDEWERCITGHSRPIWWAPWDLALEKNWMVVNGNTQIILCSYLNCVRNYTCHVCQLKRWFYKSRKVYPKI